MLVLLKQCNAFDICMSYFGFFSSTTKTTRATTFGQSSLAFGFPSPPASQLIAWSSAPRFVERKVYHIRVYSLLWCCFEAIKHCEAQLQSQQQQHKIHTVLHKCFRHSQHYTFLVQRQQGVCSNGGELLYKALVEKTKTISARLPTTTTATTPYSIHHFANPKPWMHPVLI